MALSDLDVEQIYTGDGSTTAFAVTADVTDKSEIEVWIRDESGTTIVETQQTEGNQFSFDANPPTIVTFGTAPLSTDKVIVLRVNPLTQPATFLTTGAFNVSANEEALDKATRLIQELKNLITRRIPTLPVTTTIVDLKIPEPVALGFLRFNADKDQLELVTQVAGTSITVPVSVKGDIFTHNGTANAKVGVGTDGQFLKALASESTGLVWADPQSGISAIGDWHESPGSPVASTDVNGEKVFLFVKGAAGKLVKYVKVPQGYNVGDALVMRLGFFSASSSNEWRMNIVSTLIQVNTDAITNTADQETPNSGDITNTVANQYREVTFAISDSAGKVNNVAAAAGDFLKLELTRGTPAGTDDTADIQFMPALTEVTI